MDASRREPKKRRGAGCTTAKGTCSSPLCRNAGSDKIPTCCGGDPFMPNPEDRAIVESRLNHEKCDSKSTTRRKPSARTSSPVDVTVLVRSIQRVEGNPDCFRRGRSDCEEMKCCWRPYCFEGKPVSGKTTLAGEGQAERREGPCTRR